MSEIDVMLFSIRGPSRGRLEDSVGYDKSGIVINMSFQHVLQGYDLNELLTYLHGLWKFSGYFR